MIRRLTFIVWWLGIVILALGVWNGAGRLIAWHVARRRRENKEFEDYDAV
jgi:hypothetical protein